MKPARLTGVFAAVAITIYFLAFAGPGLRAGITGDDLMNTYKAWHVPVSEHLRDTVLFWRFSDSFRPVGSLFYRTIFDRWGLDPLPFRIACYALLLANLWLAYALLRRVADSRHIAALAVLLFAYHGEYWNVFTNTGMCYDILCFFFWTAAFLYYMRARERGLPLAWPRVAVWAGLYILAMNSKEMAVSLPMVILAYELLASPPDWRRPFAWLWREGRVPMAGAVLTAAFIAGRIAAPHGLPSMEAYRPELSFLVYLNRSRHFLENALYHAGWLKVQFTPVIMGLAVVAAIVWRSLPFRLGVVWALVGILPVALIPQRGLDSAYVALPGVALSLAAAIAAAARGLRLRPAVTFAGVFAALVAVHGAYGRIDFDEKIADGRRTVALHRQLQELLHGDRVLFVNDPYPEHTWNSTFLVYLTSRDPGKRIVRADRIDEQAAPEEALDFDVVLSCERDRLVQCDAAPFRKVRYSEVGPRAAAARCGTLSGR